MQRCLSSAGVAPVAPKPLGAIKSVTKVAPAFKPAATGGAPLSSIKKFPEENPAPGHPDGIVSAKEFPKEKPAPAGEPDWYVSNSRNKTERKSEVKSTKVSNKYDLLYDGETSVEAELDDEKKGKEKGAEESGKESSSVSPESVGGNGKAPRGSTPSTTDSGATVKKTATVETSTTAARFGFGFGFGKFSSAKLLCLVFSIAVLGLVCSVFALSSKGPGDVSAFLDSVFVVPNAAAIPVDDFPNTTPESHGFGAVANPNVLPAIDAVPVRDPAQDAPRSESHYSLTCTAANRFAATEVAQRLWPREVCGELSSEVQSPARGLVFAPVPDPTSMPPPSPSRLQARRMSPAPFCDSSEYTGRTDLADSGKDAAKSLSPHNVTCGNGAKDGPAVSQFALTGFRIIRQSDTSPTIQYEYCCRAVPLTTRILTSTKTASSRVGPNGHGPNSAYALSDESYKQVDLDDISNITASCLPLSSGSETIEWNEWRNSHGSFGMFETTSPEYPAMSIPLLQGFKLSRVDSDVEYRSTCGADTFASSELTTPFECLDYYTAWSEYNEEPKNLDRHDVKCPKRGSAPSYLVAFGLQTAVNNFYTEPHGFGDITDHERVGTMRYKYTCCSQVLGLVLDLPNGSSTVQQQSTWKFVGSFNSYTHTDNMVATEDSTLMTSRATTTQDTFETSATLKLKIPLITESSVTPSYKSTNTLTSFNSQTKTQSNSISQSLSTMMTWAPGRISRGLPRPEPIWQWVTTYAAGAVGTGIPIYVQSRSRPCCLPGEAKNPINQSGECTSGINLCELDTAAVTVSTEWSTNGVRPTCQDERTFTTWPTRDNNQQLVSHHVGHQCAGTMPLTQWHAKRIDSEGVAEQQMYFEYTCCADFAPALDLDKCVTRETDPTPAGASDYNVVDVQDAAGKVQNLAKLKVSCPNDDVLTDFQLQGEGYKTSLTWKYKYQCCPLKDTAAKGQYRCDQIEPDEGGASAYIDPSYSWRSLKELAGEVNCGDAAVNSFKMNKLDDDDEDKYTYSYSCCKVRYDAAPTSKWVQLPEYTSSFTMQYSISQDTNVKGSCSSAPGGNSDLDDPSGCSSQADCEAQCNSNAGCLGYVDTNGWGYVLKNYVDQDCWETRPGFVLHTAPPKDWLELESGEDCTAQCLANGYSYTIVNAPTVATATCWCGNSIAMLPKPSPGVLTGMLGDPPIMYGDEVKILTYPDVTCPSGYTDVEDANECQALASKAPVGGGVRMGEYQGPLDNDENWIGGCFQWYPPPPPGMPGKEGPLVPDTFTSRDVYWNDRPGATTGNLGGHKICKLDDRCECYSCSSTLGVYPKCYSPECTSTSRDGTECSKDGTCSTTGNPASDLSGGGVCPTVWPPPYFYVCPTKQLLGNRGTCSGLVDGACQCRAPHPAMPPPPSPPPPSPPPPPPSPPSPAQPFFTTVYGYLTSTDGHAVDADFPEYFGQWTPFAYGSNADWQITLETGTSTSDTTVTKEQMTSKVERSLKQEVELEGLLLSPVNFKESTERTWGPTVETSTETIEQLSRSSKESYQYKLEQDDYGNQAMLWRWVETIRGPGGVASALSPFLAYTSSEGTPPCCSPTSNLAYFDWRLGCPVDLIPYETAALEKPSIPGCWPYLQEVAGYSRFEATCLDVGLVRVESARTFPSCEAACTSQSDCAGFQFGAPDSSKDIEPVCWALSADEDGQCPGICRNLTVRSGTGCVKGSCEFASDDDRRMAAPSWGVLMIKQSGSCASDITAESVIYRADGYPKD